MKPRKYNEGGSLKAVPEKSKGLSKLPEGVRNKMGYMKDGGKMSEDGEGYGQEIEVKHPDLMSAVSQMQAAVKASGIPPMHYKIKACYESEEE
jgi:hypothetical protein